MCLFTLPSQDQPLVRRDEKGDTEHEVPEPEDAHEEGKLCLICSRHDLFKTRSVQDTFHDACFCR